MDVPIDWNLISTDPKLTREKRRPRRGSAARRGGSTQSQQQQQHETTSGDRSLCCCYQTLVCIILLPIIQYSIMRTATLTLLLTCSSLPAVTQALFQEEAGLLDFLVATAGHGPVRKCGLAGQLLISSGSDDSCYLAARSVEDGSLVWRRHVCSDADAAGYQVAIAQQSVATLDRTGILNVWDAATGSLLWDEVVPDSNAVLWYTEEGGTKLAVGSRNPTFYEALTGTSTDGGGASFSKTDASGKIEQSCPQNKAAMSYSKTDGLVTSFTSDYALPEVDTVNVIEMISCTADSASFFVATERGTSIMVEVSGGKASIKWSVEEGLGAVDAAILMDASSTVDNVDQAEGEKLLTLSSRIQSQVEDMINLFTGKSVGHGRDQFFGFVKVAIMLSSKVNRLYGMETIAESRSSLRYKIDLPDAKWHKIIRGNTNALSSLHGIGGGTHARDMLVVSYSDEPKGIHWKCLDGVTGVESGSSFVSLGSPIVQILPLTSHLSCRQSAALILEDNSVVFVPEDEGTKNDAIQHLSNSPNGLYSHTVNKEKGTVESLLVEPQGSQVGVLSMGTTSFPEEKIVTVAYPDREEVIQSPCSALGDQSLLLKYINPHLFVVVTTSSMTDEDPYASLMKANKEQKRKPTGVTPPTGVEPAAIPPEERPNLFINVVDSVSGRVIHRASHASASLKPTPSVVVSENWIIYSFASEKTRRTEIGVLSLYEGMIDSKGLTAFSTPERTTAFSSVDAKEAKPVVLSKTYSMVKAITALGISATGGGISGRRLLAATLSGQIFGVDRKMLEPRRPLSKLKDTEQKEGLRQYEELIPTVSLMALSHSNTVEGVKGIVSAPTDLESQTLILAFGGPDIFYTRTSPSRGFDLLPESFSRVLLSIIVAALLAVLFAIKTRVSKKMKDQGWV
eukprot:scaffold655_cov162-Amphora_coffeaeformis.AAC.20